MKTHQQFTYHHLKKWLNPGPKYYGLTRVNSNSLIETIQHIWRKTDTSSEPQNIIPTVKQDDGSMTAEVVLPPVLLKYYTSSKKNMLSPAEFHTILRSVIFQQDKDSKHTAK